MKKTIMRGILVCLAALVLSILVPASAMISAEESGMPADPAGENDGLTWEVKKGILYINGSDKMYDFCLNCDENLPGYMVETTAPWTSYRDKVTTIVIGDGVTSIGWYSFYGFSKLKEIYLGTGITSIQSNAFENCSSLKTVYFKKSISYSSVNIGNTAFYDAEKKYDMAYGVIINYELSGGINSPKNPDYFDSNQKTVTLKNPTKKGYTFKGWYTNKKLTGTKITKLTSKIKKDTTLYAKWQRKKGYYDITYVLDYKSFNDDNNPPTYSTKETVRLKAPEKPGNTFEGWYDNSQFKGNPIKTIKAGSKGDITLYPKWKVHHYTIKFSANGGSGKMGKLTCTFGKEYTLSANKFKKKNCILSGWNTEKDGSGDFFEDKAKIINMTFDDNDTVTLYAIWKSKFTDSAVLEDSLETLKRTCQPANKWHNGVNPSYTVGSNGQTIWSCRTTANGALGTIIAKGRNETNIGYTSCRWNEPILTSTQENSSDEGYEYQKSIIEGTYDFDKDPAKIKIGWFMYTDETSKSAFQKMINNKISDDVFNEAIAKFNYMTSMQMGNSVNIIYGRNSKDKLIGMFAGSVYYNWATDCFSYYLVGINPENEEYYGKVTSGSIDY